VPSRLVTLQVASDAGHGPPVVMVHGVGIGAWSFAVVASALATDHRVLVPHRRGYGPRGDDQAEAATVADHVDDLVRLLDARGLPAATFVGVSGGATLVLALAIAAPAVVQAAVIHEPLVGPLAPRLHAVVGSSSARLLSCKPGPDGVVDFMAGLVGEEHMAVLPAPTVDALRARWPVIRAEVAAFVTFAPSSADLARVIDVDLVTTVGSRSPRHRQEAAAVVSHQTGARVEIVEGARHLPQLEAPNAFEAVVRQVAAIAAGRL